MRRRLTDRLVAAPGARLGALRDLPLPSKVALSLLTVLGLVALFAPLLVPAGPYAIGPAVQPPGAEHWFGTDGSGRDILARVVYGARSSLLIGLCATGGALLVAAVLGSIAATSGRVVSEILMRILDIVMSFPGIALAAVFVAVWGTSLPVIIFAIGFLYVPQLARVIRANVLAQFGEDYVAASRVMGASTTRILIKHVARNTLAPIMVFATVLVADAIVLEASLSFINAGVRPPDPSWGNILAEGKQLLLSGYWWPTFFPGLMILLTVLSLNVLAEGLTDALASPRIRRSVDVEADEEAQTGAPSTEPTVADELPSQGMTVGVTGNVMDLAAEEPAEFDTEEHNPGATPGEGAATDGVADLGGPAVGAGDGRPVLGRTDAQQARALLAASLETLRVAEQGRTDRLVYDDPSAEPLLEVRNLSIAFPEAHGDVDIVDDVSFSVRPGETMGLVGESGCGKSITAMSIMGLLPPTARISGEIRFEGQDVLTLTATQRNALRGHAMAMVYQDALSSLNPSMLVSSQLQQLIRRGGKRTAAELMELVDLDPKRTLKSYPHELSGGQRQRVLIAMALTRNPRLLIADEPTTALDVTVQQQVVDLLNELRRELGFAMVFVSHDLALVAQLAHRITVMYAGQVVEQGATSELLLDPRHEYTRGLLGSVLSIESGAARLHQVPGTVPSPRDFVAGDRFALRSAYAGIGVDTRPDLRLVPGTTHSYASTDALESVKAQEAHR
ncbi:dipeptide/oligopeptide/nickel ABC transporter permease/ATP-binding protein [Ornithinimicrobium cryptoxanthini]|uniref:Dipeptide/oligopeptide/nickel ABC transporter permease/ATP-binding protein n=1 Tax=Ornithinimicrobium cryptoxanthini TaxID=2934161 RepID=A0ABY4YKA8_9MICO|nr:dipeptide/oligopeptide/nickel ABC transporter permease/ATP-binding protein [Ornithinimicrobium cryptoxanthini]USQ76986.1 dipeptide/oligopeptide/nickel ABC transporter permease/ATP-binding protein [Ornithinimicrobium cryptoxanthini]